MGGGISTQRPKPPPPGCFVRTVTAKDFANGMMLWMGSMIGMDCDCRSLKTCPAGPPPVPPLEEFMGRKILEKYADCPVSKTFFETPPENGWWWPGEIEQMMPPMKRGLDESDASGLKVPLRAAIDGLPLDKRQGLPDWFGIFPGTLDIPEQKRDIQPLNGTTLDAHAVDQVALLNLLLATPERHAGDVVKALSKEQASTLLTCTEYSINFALDGIKHAQKHSHAEVTAEQTEYTEYLVTMSDRWKKHTPLGLSRQVSARASLGTQMPTHEKTNMQHDKESAMFLNQSDKAHHGKGSLAVVRLDETETHTTSRHGIRGDGHLLENTTSRTHNNEDNGNNSTRPTQQTNAICSQVHAAAVRNVRDPATGGKRYMATFEQILAALDKQLDDVHSGASNNTYLNALRQPGDADVPGKDLVWTQYKLRTVFEEAYPALEVGLDFFVLSVFTGAVAQW